MKTKILTALIVASFLIHHAAFGQGALTPPGVPGPTMLTLSQIEPRTPISSSPFTITQPGSYYLTTNLTVNYGASGITIDTNNVTLDLNGFTISSMTSSANGTGILFNVPAGARNITILNGSILSGVTNNGSGVYGGSGFNSGIVFNFTSPTNVRISGVSVSGMSSYGIALGPDNSTVVESCTVETAGTYGIWASTVRQSSAIDCGNTAIDGDQVSDCHGQSTGGDGISATVVQNSYGYSINNNYGIYAFSALNCYGYNNGNGGGIEIVSNAKNCYGYNTSGGYGINSGGSGGTTVESCQGYSNSGIGIFAYTVQNCYSSSATGTGISADTALNCLGYVTSSGAGSFTYGVSTATAENCFGDNFGSGYGIYASAAALNCDGISSTGTGLYAFIANGSHGSTISTFHNVNSF